MEAAPLPRPKKKPLDQKTDETMKKLFPPEAVQEAKKTAKESQKGGA
jgi:hypothetical protein